MLKIQTNNRHNPTSSARGTNTARRMAAVLLFGLAIGLPAAALAADAKAAPQADRAPGSQAHSSNVDISAAQAGRAAQKIYGGKVLNVTLKNGSRMQYYQVKLLSGGEVRLVRVAANR